MIGIILTGHGYYASGMVSAANLIIGSQKNMTIAEFTETESPETLRKKIENGVESLRADEILILSDLVGGTPFKVSLEITRTDNKVKVIGGANLGMIIDTLLSKDNVDSVDQLILKAKISGVEAIDYFEIKEDSISENEVL